MRFINLLQFGQKLPPGPVKQSDSVAGSHSQHALQLVANVIQVDGPAQYNGSICQEESVHGVANTASGARRWSQRPHAGLFLQDQGDPVRFLPASRNGQAMT